MARLNLTQAQGREKLPAGLLISVEPGTLHPSACFWVFHEGVPNERRPRILRHYQSDPGIDSDDVGIVPVLRRIEGVDEAVAAPGIWILSFDCAQHTHGWLRQKR